jgi:hypothetical protein
MSDSLFKTAPKEVIAYFDARPAVPTFDWRDLAAREHALAHTVAKTAGLNILEDLQKAIRKAVVDRVPFEQFRDELIPLLRQRGWWGEKKVSDPKTGEMVKAQLGSLRRLQVIYWANVHSAHAAGEWTRTQANKEFLPWLTYMPSVSERKRPLHISWYGTTLRVDDPWWRSHYPPNGWNCKCSVRQIGDREAERLHKEFGRDKTPPLDERPWHNKRTGETEMIPAGIDPGWQHNPGMLRDRTLSRQLQGALDRMPEEARVKAVTMLKDHPVMEYVTEDLGRRKREEIRNQPEGRFSAVIGLLPNEARKAIGAKTSIIRLSGETASHILGDHPEISGENLRELGALISSGMFVKRGPALNVFVETEGGVYRAAIKTTEDQDEVFISTLHRSNRKQLKRISGEEN